MGGSYNPWKNETPWRDDPLKQLWFILCNSYKQKYYEYYCSETKRILKFGLSATITEQKLFHQQLLKKKKITVLCVKIAKNTVLFKTATL